MELDWSVDREGDASLVGVRVRNDAAVPRRVRIESRLDGAVLPPRRGGVAEAGWDAGGVTAVIGPGAREAFGFATLSDPVEPPVEITSVAPATPGTGGDQAVDGDERDPVRTAVRDLGDHRPPRRAVDESEAGDRDEGGSNERDWRGPNDRDWRGPNDRDAHEPDGDDTGAGAECAEPTDESPESTGEGDTEPTGSAPSPDDIEAWFAAVEARIERAERLTDADLATATAVVEESGGLGAVEALDGRVAADAESLRAVRDRAAALAERAEESDVPAASLEALA